VDLRGCLRDFGVSGLVGGKCGRRAQGRLILLVYALFPTALECVAAGAQNFHRWHSFLESMEAWRAAVAAVNTYKLLGAMVCI
jgi:hypothetical protein